MNKADSFGVNEELGNEEIAVLNFVNLRYHFEGDECCYYGDFSDPIKVTKFMGTEIGKAQVAWLEKELGVEGELSGAQAGDILHQAQLLQKCGFMKPGVEGKIDPGTGGISLKPIDYPECEVVAKSEIVSAPEGDASGGFCVADIDAGIEPNPELEYDSDGTVVVCVSDDTVVINNAEETLNSGDLGGAFRNAVDETAEYCIDSAKEEVCYSDAGAGLGQWSDDSDPSQWVVLIHR